MSEHDNQNPFGGGFGGGYNPMGPRDDAEDAMQDRIDEMGDELADAASEGVSNALNNNSGEGDGPNDINCPPGSIPDLPDPGPGGDEPIDEQNYPDLGFPEFLSPIEEIDEQQFSTSKSLREINIFDEFLFLRHRENIFSTDNQGNSIILTPGFHRQIETSFKRSRIQNHYLIITAGEIVEKPVPEDLYRIENNKFWLLRGSEQAPIQEEWASTFISPELQEKKYDLISLQSSTSTGVSAIEGFYPIAKQELSLSILNSNPENEITEINNILNSSFAPGITHEDFNTSIQQPLLASEASNLQDDMIAKSSYVIDFKPVINNRNVNFVNSQAMEYNLPSLYREYRRLSQETDEDCEIEDKIQKFLSSNFTDMDGANASTILAERNPNYVEITIKRPNPPADGSSILEKIISNFEATQMDKYYIEALCGYSNQFVNKKFIQITDEVSPTTTQTVRANDRFSINYLKVSNKDFTTILSDMSDSEKFEQHVNNVVSNSQHYPLRYRKYDDVIQLQTDDTNNRNLIEENIKEINQAFTRTWNNCVSGEKASSHIIGYKIEKFAMSGDVPSQVPLQTFYIMERPQEKDSTDIPPIVFRDTQVHYEKTYRYRVYSIAVVHGTQYVYNEYDNSTGLFSVTYNGAAKIYEAPFYQKIISLRDLPPLPPEVSFVPYQGKSNKIRIIFNHSVGERKERPIKILDSDKVIIDSMRSSQEGSEKEIIRYYSDTIPQEYQMFYTSIPPQSFRNFSDGERDFIPTNNSLSVMKELNIQPNREYYFTFRSAETSGISNPSPVYKLRLVDNPNGIFMVLSEYDIYTQTETYITHEFQRALMISPSLLQRSIRYPEGTDMSSIDFSRTAPSDLSLGVSSKSIWDKNYKFRITSKTSGKKIDLNVKFKQNSVENTPVQEPIRHQCDPIIPPEIPREPEPVPEPSCISTIPSIPLFEGYFTPRALRHFPEGQCGPGVDIPRLPGSNQENINFNVNWNNPLGDMNLVEWLKQIPAVMAYCACDENPNELIDFLKPAVRNQAQRRESGQDFRFVFGPKRDDITDDLIPPRLKVFNIPANNRNNAFNEAIDFWTKPLTYKEIYQIYINKLRWDVQLERMGRTQEDVDADPSWRGRQLLTDFERIQLMTEWNPASISEDGVLHEMKQYKCLQVVREVLSLFKPMYTNSTSYRNYNRLRDNWTIFGLNPAQYVSPPVTDDFNPNESTTWRNRRVRDIELLKDEEPEHINPIGSVPDELVPPSFLTPLLAARERDSDEQFAGSTDLFDYPCADGYQQDPNFASRFCIPICPEGTQLDDTGCECVPIPPPPCQPEGSGKIRNEETGECECPAGQVFDETAGKCVDEPVEPTPCPQGFERQTEDGECLPIQVEPPCHEVEVVVKDMTNFPTVDKKVQMSYRFMPQNNKCVLDGEFEYVFRLSCQKINDMEATVQDGEFTTGEYLVDEITLTFKFFATVPAGTTQSNAEQAAQAAYDSAVMEVQLHNAELNNTLATFAEQKEAGNIRGSAAVIYRKGDPTREVNISNELIGPVMERCQHTLVCNFPGSTTPHRGIDSFGKPFCFACGDNQEFVDGQCVDKVTSSGDQTQTVELIPEYYFKFGLIGKGELDAERSQDAVNRNVVIWKNEWVRIPSPAELDEFGGISSAFDDAWNVVTFWIHPPGWLTPFSLPDLLPGTAGTSFGEFLIGGQTLATEHFRPGIRSRIPTNQQINEITIERLGIFDNNNYFTPASFSKQYFDEDEYIQVSVQSRLDRFSEDPSARYTKQDELTGGQANSVTQAAADGNLFAGNVGDPYQSFFKDIFWQGDNPRSGGEFRNPMKYCLLIKKVLDGEVTDIMLVQNGGQALVGGYNSLGTKLELGFIKMSPGIPMAVYDKHGVPRGEGGAVRKSFTRENVDPFFEQYMGDNSRNFTDENFFGGRVLAGVLAAAALPGVDFDPNTIKSERATGDALLFRQMLDPYQQTLNNITKRNGGPVKLKIISLHSENQLGTNHRTNTARTATKSLINSFVNHDPVTKEVVILD